jgi:hypothetical protein
MQSEYKPITVIYKGTITQDTGEDWNDVPLTLETATPTFGVNLPTLTPWTLSVYSPAPVGYIRARGAGPLASELRPMTAKNLIGHCEMQVSSKGYVSATFSVPGQINIPSDNVGHNVTIVNLTLDATMNWVSIPKKDTRVHLKASFPVIHSMWGLNEVVLIGPNKECLGIHAPSWHFECICRWELHLQI